MVNVFQVSKFLFLLLILLTISSSAISSIEAKSPHGHTTSNQLPNPSESQEHSHLRIYQSGEEYNSNAKIFTKGQDDTDFFSEQDWNRIPNNSRRLLSKYFKDLSDQEVMFIAGFLMLVFVCLSCCCCCNTNLCQEIVCFWAIWEICFDD